MADSDEVFIHPKGLCDSDAVGGGTRVWAFAHVAAGARVGRDCNICDGVFLERGALIGDRVTLKSGVQVWDGVELRDDVFVGPNATFTNDRFPRSRQWLEEHLRTVVREGASIGANATILPGLEIGRGAMVGAGAVVTRSVPANAIVVGNPARIAGYATAGRDALAPSAAAPTNAQAAVAVGGVQVHQFEEHLDMRGRLTAGDVPGEAVPFTPRRWFVVYDVPSRDVRGEHAHRTCQQFLVCVAGSLNVVVDDGAQRATVRLDKPSIGIYVPPLVWSAQFDYDASTALLVLASHQYDPTDYVREYDEFLSLVDERRAGANHPPVGRPHV